jgi:hypothetical protein
VQYLCKSRVGNFQGQHQEKIEASEDEYGQAKEGKISTKSSTPHLIASAPNPPELNR